MNLYSSTGMLGHFTKKSELSLFLSGRLATLLLAAVSQALVPNGLSRDAQFLLNLGHPLLPLASSVQTALQGHCSIISELS